MTRTQAHALLDAAKAGASIPAKAIVKALIATGDLGNYHVVRAERKREAVPA